MNWSFLEPALYGVIITGVVGVMALVANNYVAWNINKKKMLSEMELAEKRFNHEKLLSDQKFEYDMKLAERRFEFEKELADRKLFQEFHVKDRQARQNLAEELIAGFYEVSDMVQMLRSRIAFNGEGRTRPRQPGESPTDAAHLDARFAIQERFNKNRDVIARLNSKEYRAIAWFGPSVRTSFQDVNGAIREILVANEMLTEDEKHNTGVATPEMIALRQTIYGSSDGKDRISTQVKDAVARIEAICGPILRELAGA